MARILIAIDSKDLPEILGQTLQNDGFDAEFVRSGSQAMQRLVTGTFDLVVIDWEMPQVTGVRICRGYRERGGAGHILALFSKNGAEARREFLAAGANEVMPKPPNVADLRNKIIEVLGPAPKTGNDKPAAAPKEKDNNGGLIGKTLSGRYEILSHIGEGGMGIVYKARHLSLGRLVAVKVMIEDLARDNAALQRFQREARVLSAVEHPNLILVHDFGETENKQPFLVMELLEGKTLEEIIEKHGKLPLALAIEVFVEICEGMQAAHDQGLIHRDLKPANVMLVKKNEKRMCKILDMGLAKFVDKKAAKLTQTGQIFGSPLYMSPEQCLSKTMDHRSDVYSLGCLMYEALCGHVPFTGENFVSTSLKHVSDTPPSMRDTCPELPEELEQLVLDCLKKTPEERPASMTEVRDRIVKVRSVTKLSTGS